MDKDRIEGSAKQIKGTVKEAVGKVLGDKKLETEGTKTKISETITKRMVSSSSLADRPGSYRGRGLRAISVVLGWFSFNGLYSLSPAEIRRRR